MSGTTCVCSFADRVAYIWGWGMGGVIQSARIVLGSPSETLELLNQFLLDVLTAPLCVVLLHSVSEHGDALTKELEGPDTG